MPREAWSGSGREAWNVRRFRYAWPDRLARLCYDGGIPTSLLVRPWTGLLVPGLLGGMFREALACAAQSDVIHCHWTICGFVGLLARSLHPQPVVVTTHGSDVSMAETRLGLRMLNAHVVRRADAMVVVGSRQVPALAAAGGPRLRVVHVPYGVSEEFLEQPPAPRRDVDLVFVGRLAPEKRPDLLIEALAALNRRGVRPVVRLVGEGPLRDLLAARIRQEQLWHVQLVGQVPQDKVVEEMDRARALALVSTREGLPTVVLQAMARGLAVLCTDVGSVRDVVCDGTTGLLVPPELAAGELADRLEAFLREPDRLVAMGRAGRAVICEHYTWDRAAAKYYDLYQAVLTGSRVPG